VKFQAHLHKIREQHKFNLLARALKAAVRVLLARSALFIYQVFECDNGVSAASMSFNDAIALSPADTVKLHSESVLRN
jgi:hypothetical protein